MLAAVAATRLLVPVVAVLAEADSDGTEKETEMALPTLIGNDGRKAVIAFTGTAALQRWSATPAPSRFPRRGCGRPWPRRSRRGGRSTWQVRSRSSSRAPAARARQRRAAAAARTRTPTSAPQVAAVTPDFALGPGGPDAT